MSDPDDLSGPIPSLRALPAVGAVLARPAIRASMLRHGAATVTRAVRETIEAERRRLLAGGADPRVTNDDVRARIERLARGSLVAVINASGVVVHTNLGRAPLAAEAIAAIAEVAAGYTTLEYDRDEGTRGERHHHARDLLVELTGAEDALVVNNNAGAVLLALAAHASGREVVVSRGELVEIGGGFRIPDVLAQSGAKLVEVGTTNRTHPRDYERAIGAGTALLLKVHRSNFAIVGFTAEVSVRELARTARSHGIIVACDAGSGCLTAALADGEEPTVASLVADGADLVMFSGDKLLGGPQAGIVVGRSRLLEPMRQHPLQRALRPDKLCLAALVATLRLWRDDPSRIPVVRFATVAPSELEERARRVAAELAPRAAVAVPTVARLGGGSAPLRALASWGVRVSGEPGPAAIAERLRSGAPPVIGRIEDGGLVLDLRCVPPEQDRELARAVAAALAPRGSADG